MAKVVIVHPSGIKTEISREQLVELARSGQVTADAQLEVSGRIIPARKIKELQEFFVASATASSTPAPSPFSNGVASTLKTNASASVPPIVSESAHRATDAVDGFFSDLEFSSNHSSPTVEVPQGEAFHSKARRLVTRLVRDDAHAHDSVSQRARERTKSMTAPFSLCRILCLALGGLTIVGRVIVFLFSSFRMLTHSYFSIGFKLRRILEEFIACLGVIIATSLVCYVLWGVFNYVVQYARQRAEDSVRREDFYNKALQLLEETANKAE